MFILIAFTMIAYGLGHSWLASIGFKQMMQRVMGNRRFHGLYRALYNLIAIVTLTPILGLVLLYPGETVWQFSGSGHVVSVAVQITGMIGVCISLGQIRLGEFIGIAQFAAYARGTALPLPQEALQTGGMYRLVRHPLYLFSLMVIWPMSTMTESWLAFNVLATLYFVVGMVFEERKLLAMYGEVYRDYQARTPALLPLWK